MNIKALIYVWAKNASIGDKWPNAFVAKNVMMCALRAKKNKTATWYFEKRNIFKDLKNKYGTEFQYINAIAIMTDSDNTMGIVTSYYGGIYFTSE